jgi:hypothetical protein
VRIEGNTPIHISVSVEPINPCAIIHKEAHHHLDNQNSGEGIQHEVHLHKGKKQWDPVHEALVKYPRHVKVVFQHSGW